MISLGLAAGSWWFVELVPTNGHAMIPIAMLLRIEIETNHEPAIATLTPLDLKMLATNEADIVTMNQL